MLQDNDEGLADEASDSVTLADQQRLDDEIAVLQALVDQETIIQAQEAKDL